MTFKQVEHQNWVNFKVLKTWILYNFKRAYIIKINYLIKIKQTKFTNHNTTGIYEKKVENGNRERKYY